MILITGMPGTGKTTLLKSLDLPNVYIIDDINRQVWIHKGQKYYNFIKENFSNCISGDIVNTSKLGKIIFSDPEKLNLLNAFVIPHLVSFFNSLPKNSIIEYAPYLDHEEEFKKCFNKVVLIKRKVPITGRKFKYIKGDFSPIKNSDIKFDYLIENKTFDVAKKDLLSIINKYEEK